MQWEVERQKKKRNGKRWKEKMKEGNWEIDRHYLYRNSLRDRQTDREKERDGEQAGN